MSYDEEIKMVLDRISNASTSCLNMLRTSTTGWDDEKKRQLINAWINLNSSGNETFQSGNNAMQVISAFFELANERY